MLHQDRATAGATRDPYASGAVDERDVRKQVAFREVNERIAELVAAWSSTGVSLFICECSDQDCAETLEITSLEYERVRADGAHFVVAAGHQLPGQERVVEGKGRFVVVEKIGRAGAIARASDARRHA